MLDENVLSFRRASQRVPDIIGRLVMYRSKSWRVPGNQGQVFVPCSQNLHDPGIDLLKVRILNRVELTMRKMSGAYWESYISLHFTEIAVFDQKCCVFLGHTLDQAFGFRIKWRPGRVTALKVCSFCFV